MEDKIQEFLQAHNYDIRITGESRWIDQKCTLDVLCMVADCIVEFSKEHPGEGFTTKDIWYSDYAKKNIQQIFKKPDPQKKSKNEYDKWFGQPLKLLGASYILNETKKGRSNFYTIENIELLNYIASRERNSHHFLILYLKKVLSDSGILTLFETFFEEQTKQSYQILKKSFEKFTTFYTPINGKKECNRIFTKVINPLAFEQNKLGTKGGYLSKSVITLDMLYYNRLNFRDIASDKPKEISRKENESSKEYVSYEHLLAYHIQKAKKQLREYTAKYRNNKTECEDSIHIQDAAVHCHHIFPASDFPEISYYVENLIALTPTQHLSYAHPNGNTREINVEYQKKCILSKVQHIKECFMHSDWDQLYRFDSLIQVLNTGFHTDRFLDVPNMDFDFLIENFDFLSGLKN